jgi:release factor glutamine methyltransferase
MDELDPGVRRWEPRGALEAGPRGVEAVEIILADATGWLAEGGAAVIEIAPHQAAEVAGIARRSGFAEIAVHADLAGRDRTLVVRRP